MTTATTIEVTSYDSLSQGDLEAYNAEIDAELIRIERNSRIFAALDQLDDLSRWIVCRHTGFPVYPGDFEQKPASARELSRVLKRVVNKRFTVAYTNQAIDYAFTVLADALNDFEGVGL